MNGLNITEYSFSGNNGPILPKNDKARLAVEAFYAASQRAKNELGCEIELADETSVSRLYQIPSGNSVNPVLLVQYISGNRNYTAQVKLGGKDISVSSLDSVVDQIMTNLLNPDAKVNHKRKKKSARLIAKPDAKVDEEFDLKYNSEEE
jgi:hypothetical protein